MGEAYGHELPEIEATRVRLRTVEARDVDDLWSVFSDPEVTRYWSHPPWASIDLAHDYVRAIHRHARDRALFQWAIARREDDRLVGTVTLSKLDFDHGRAEIGFALRRDAHGRGYGREAVSAALGHAFGALGLRRVEADVDPRNVRSIGLLESLGFRTEGFLRERWYVGGRPQDSVILGLLRGEWRRDRERHRRDPGSD